MERRTSERLVNLTIALLTARRYLSRDQVRDMVEGYRGLADAAFDRQFERDKQTLRDLGVPIEVGSDEVFFDDEPGYRIRRSNFELPSVSFDPEEVAVLVCAAQVWQQASSADSTTAALAKLWACGIEPDTGRLAALRPHISAREPAWHPLWQAVQAREKVRFAYHGQTRVVQPWMLAWRGGAWYLGGYDETRGDRRVFKLARLVGQVVPVSPPQAFEVPDVSSDELFAHVSATLSQSEAIIDVRCGRAPWLTRRSKELPGSTLPGWQRWCVPDAAVDEVAMAGADARVVEPGDLADEVAAHHAGLLEHLVGQQVGAEASI